MILKGKKMQNIKIGTKKIVKENLRIKNGIETMIKAIKNSNTI
jgi:hypothetical protein